MPRRPPTSGYARLAQAEEEEEEEYLDDSDAEDRTFVTHAGHQYTAIQPGGRSRMRAERERPSEDITSTLSRKKRFDHNRKRTNSGVDIKAINARLERWADEIANKFKIRKIKGKNTKEEALEIHYSVFQPPNGVRPATAESLASPPPDQPHEKLNKMQFDDIVESIRVAIELGVHPKLVSQGSSGSYFARNSDGKIVGIFKPKDEEPYATKNPKWTKWIHRNLFPCFFGRACLIPNLSYISESAAYVLDTRLQTNIVPYTDIVQLSSIAFNYDFWDRRSYYRKRKPLPQKIGSLQVFLKGYEDATQFLKRHPWPDPSRSYLRSHSRSNQHSLNWTNDCRTAHASEEEDYAQDSGWQDGDATRPSRSQSQIRDTFWSPALQLSFREQLERLVILDYIMRNTDRGLDNWMIRVDDTDQTASVDADASLQDPDPPEGQQPDKRTDSMAMEEHSDPAASRHHHVSLGAIDNSLSWPWKHPDAWRSFPFGWLFLPVSLIGQAFSERTRQHFLPLLTSKQWWSETQVALRQCFSQDSDFQERMFARQIAVMKGQAWNVVETLKIPDHGPLELTRRARVLVWDDLVEIPTVVPLRSSSYEVRRRKEETILNQAQREEMDISSVRDTDAASSHAQLGISGPSETEVPSSTRFNFSRQNSNDDGIAATIIADVVKGDSAGSFQPSPSSSRPLHAALRPRMSHDERRPKFVNKKNHRKRNLSFSARSERSRHTFDEYDDDDDDGDLGYSVARNRETDLKRVIVERMEQVKASNPVFTWC